MEKHDYSTIENFYSAIQLNLNKCCKLYFIMSADQPMLIVPKFIARIADEFKIDEQKICSIWDSMVNSRNPMFTGKIQESFTKMLNNDLPPRSLESEPMWDEIRKIIKDEIEALNGNKFRGLGFERIRKQLLEALCSYHICSSGQINVHLIADRCIARMNEIVSLINEQPYINMTPDLELIRSPDEEQMIFRFDTCYGHGNSWFQEHWNEFMHLKRDQLTFIMSNYRGYPISNVSVKELIKTIKRRSK